MEIFLFYETKKKSKQGNQKRAVLHKGGGSHTRVCSPEVREHPQVPTLSLSLSLSLSGENTRVWEVFPNLRRTHEYGSCSQTSGEHTSMGTSLTT